MRHLLQPLGTSFSESIQFPQTCLLILVQKTNKHNETGGYVLTLILAFPRVATMSVVQALYNTEDDSRLTYVTYRWLGRFYFRIFSYFLLFSSQVNTVQNFRKPNFKTATTCRPYCKNVIRSTSTYLEPPAPARDSSEEHREQTEGARSRLWALIGSGAFSLSVSARTVEHFLRPEEENILRD